MKNIMGGGVKNNGLRAEKENIASKIRQEAIKLHLFGLQAHKLHFGHRVKMNLKGVGGGVL